MGDAYLYGRTAHAADCATLKIPADERPLCPSPSVAATLGVDGLVNNVRRAARAVPAGQRPARRADQHPAAAAAVRLQRAPAAADAGGRRHRQGLGEDLRPDQERRDRATPRSRAGSSRPAIPTIHPGITHYGAEQRQQRLRQGRRRRVRPRQPGPRPPRCGTTSCTAGTRRDRCSCFGLLAGLAGIFTYRRRRDPGANRSGANGSGAHGPDARRPGAWVGRVAGPGPGLPADHRLGGVAVLLGADLYEFSWRYQLPALITLPIAGALGATAVVRYVRARRPSAGSAGGSRRPRR